MSPTPRRPRFTRPSAATTQDLKLNKKLETLEGEVEKYTKQGTITKINTPQGCYHVVVGSFIDEDLALDQANRLAQQGVNVTIIAPSKGQLFSRLAIEPKPTYTEAHEKAETLKAAYGTDIWVMKY